MANKFNNRVISEFVVSSYFDFITTPFSSGLLIESPAPDSCISQCFQNTKIILQEVSTESGTMRRIMKSLVHFYGFRTFFTCFYPIYPRCYGHCSYTSAILICRMVILLRKFIVTYVVFYYNIAFCFARSSTVHNIIFSLFTALYRGLFFPPCQNTLTNYRFQCQGEESCEGSLLRWLVATSNVEVGGEGQTIDHLTVFRKP